LVVDETITLPARNAVSQAWEVVPLFCFAAVQQPWPINKANIDADKRNFASVGTPHFCTTNKAFFFEDGSRLVALAVEVIAWLANLVTTCHFPGIGASPARCFR
jgi:hypothetical protein